MKLFLFSILICLTSYANHLSILKETFVKTEKFKLFNLKTQEIKLGSDAQKQWLPVQLETSLYRTQPFYGDKTETAQSTGSVTKNTDTFNTSLTYNSFSSFKNVFNAQYARSEFDTTYNASISSGRSYDLSNRLEYNFANGGRNSTQQLSQSLEIASLNISELNFLKNLNTEFIDFSQKLLNYLILDCKIKNQTTIKNIADETLKKGKALLDVNLISRKDYLNYENMQIELENTLARLSNEFLLAQYNLESVGFSLDKDLEKDKFIKVCQLSNPIDYVQALGHEDIKKNIDLEILNKQVEVDNLQLKSSKRNTIANIVPFVELGMNSNLAQESKDYRIIAGVSVGWDITNERQQSLVSFKNFSKQYTAGDYQLTKKKIEFDLLSLVQDLKYIAQLFEITKRNLKSNDDLLKILRLENSIKKGDSLNFSSTISSRANLVNNYFDLIQQNEIKNLQLTLLKDGKWLVN